MKAKPNELQIIRVYDAPVKLVWNAWTDPNEAAHWWGPRGFTITTKSKDFKVGGKWIYTMHGPDGVDYPNITTYHEIKEYEKMVYDHGGNDERQKLFTVTVTFKEELGKTIMNMIMALDTEEAAKEISKFIKKAGGNGTWDRLAEYLEDNQNSNDPFFINRTFNAPKKLIFEAWTKPEHFSKWMGPTGASMDLIKADVKEGGSLQYSMKNADGSSMYGMIHYKTILPYDLLVYSQNFCDENGKLCKPPFAPTWPDSMLTTIIFADEGENQTRVTLKWVANKEATTTEKETFHQAKAGMTGGWTGSFDKLEDYLKNF